MGCNWWASHAGTNMWKEWRPDIVEDDFKRLSDAKINVVRVFPLWSDFQPLRMHCGAGNTSREMRMNEDPLPETEAGRAGVDEVMADRFGILCDLAEKHGLRLIVGIVTGWMSGRMHAPEAFANKHLLSDPEVIFWQIKFVRYMVKRFKDKPAIAAWDLGNECNCLDFEITRYQAANWAALITNTIKAEDPTRLVISGLHGCLPDDSRTWNTRDLGENLDVLCTHPYPLFTPHCNTDPLGEMKTVLHSTAETLLYADTSGKPAFIEEIGTLGPMISSEEIAGNYIRAAQFSAWAHNLYGFVWWCANEQSHLTHTPYDWDTVERELGLFRADKTAKPVLLAMSEFSAFLERFEYGKLPERIVDAAVVLTKEQDTWANAYGTFILAKQAGLDVSFAWCEDKLPDSNVYIIPGVCGTAPISLHKYNEIFEKAKGGATVVLSLDTALLSPFREYFGLRVLTRSARTGTDFAELEGGERIPLFSSFKVLLESVGAEVLLFDDKGVPAVTEYKFGKGRVCLINAPIEQISATRPHTVSGTEAIPYYRIYELLSLRSDKKIARSSLCDVCVTEHPLDENTRLLCILNYSPEKKCAKIALDGGFEFERIIKVSEGVDASSAKRAFSLSLDGNTGVVAVVKRKL